MRIHFLFVAWLAAFSVTACHCGGDDPPQDPCDALECGAGTCRRDGDGAVCDCQQHAAFDGTTCVLDPCLGIDCSMQGACIARDGGTVCRCEDGFVAVGDECVWRRHLGCEDLACGPGSGCTTTTDGFRCACPEGTRSTGTTCEPMADNPCQDVACSGHGACTVVSDAPSCTCDAGYDVSADGLACIPNAPVEACVAVGADCAGALTFESCCTGAHCEYVASTGERYEAGTDAEQHCVTGIAGGSTYGACVGEPTDCAYLDSATCTSAGCILHEECTGASPTCPTNVTESACELAGCVFSRYCGHPGGTGQDFGRNCGSNRTEAACDLRIGCDWVEHTPVAAAEADSHCAALTMRCAPGRDYHLCCDNECEALFEDGTVLRGTQTIAGYCLGQLTPAEVAAEDGRCLSRCQGFTTEAQCTAGSCNWNANVSECEGRNPQCFFEYTQASCEAFGGCLWFAGDEPIRVPDDGQMTGTYDPELPPGSFVALTNPITVEECADVAIGCHRPMARLVSIGGGPLDKVLPNTDYNVMHGASYRAIAAGRVTVVSNAGGDDNGILVVSRDNPNMSYSYDHVTSPMVSVGDDVLPGDVLGMAEGPADLTYGFEVSITENLGGYGPIDVCPQRVASSRYMAELRAFQFLSNLAQPDGADTAFYYAVCYADGVFSF